ncbi:hypothetical protein BS78_07G038900 [Paspalum vaginatum]|nr:hypothetical protein BS78_07G038900 [Paspalum vaginatum]
MKRAALTTVLATLLSLAATLIAGGDACDKVPVMRWADACDKAAPEVAEVSVYALVAARSAARSYGALVGTAKRLIDKGSVSDDQRGAYQRCIDGYATAHTKMESAMAELMNCDFTRTRQHYVDAVAAMESCGKGLSSAGTPPLVDMNAADKDRTLLAYDLGALIVGK